jgi:hypothetical protein
VRGFWSIISGYLDNLLRADQVVRASLVPFLVLGSYLDRLDGGRFAPYRRTISHGLNIRRSCFRYTARANDPLMVWLGEDAGRAWLFASTYSHWTRFPDLFVSALLYPGEVEYGCNKVLALHKARKLPLNGGDRGLVRYWANHVVRLLERPPQLRRLHERMEAA